MQKIIKTASIALLALITATAFLVTGCGEDTTDTTTGTTTLPANATRTPQNISAADQAKYQQALTDSVDGLQDLDRKSVV